jgi:hypothetical protein
MELKDENNNLIAVYLSAMEAKCIHCKKFVSTDDGAFLVLGPPYHGCIHRWCAPYYKYNGEWPHAMPMVFYTEKKQIV